MPRRSECGGRRKLLAGAAPRRNECGRQKEPLAAVDRSTEDGIPAEDNDVRRPLRRHGDGGDETGRTFFPIVVVSPRVTRHRLPVSFN